MTKDEAETISERTQALKAKLAAIGAEPRPFIHPTMADRYRANVKALCILERARGRGNQRTLRKGVYRERDKKH